MTDGNFVLNHLMSRGGSDGISLTNGAAYMVGNQLLAAHIPSSDDTDQVCYIDIPLPPKTFPMTPPL